MENKRADLAEKMEIIGQIFEIDGMAELLQKYQAGMSPVKFNAVTIQVSSLLLKTDKSLADKIIAMSLEETDETVQGMDDGVYAQALKNAIITDVMGFFASPAPTAGKK
ncbi:MAG: hypothetical protein J6W44_04315 [Oscillospiraceae bacterium]|nr:hypothetical protein [Oscillospiraceae bacterium]